MSHLHVVLVPGFWEGPNIYKDVESSLKSYGYEVTMAPLVSTGKAASEAPDRSPSMYDDIAAIRKVLSQLVDQGKKLLVVRHSAGAMLSAHAVQGLSEKDQSTAGKSGGVAKFAFVTGALFPVGHLHSPAPFFDIQGSEMYCKSPRQVLFNDLPDDKAEAQVKALSCQPSSGWDGKVEYAGWEEIPNGYLVCEQDAAIPPPWQEQMASMASSNPIDKCNAGHCAPATQPTAVTNFVRKCAGESI